MGGWGPGLYQDDEALDLKNMIALLSKMPADSDRLLEILAENQGKLPKLTDDNGPTFWLVLADQFEKKGIASEKVFGTALEAIDSGADLRDLKDRGMEPKDLEKRAKMLKELGARLRKPRPLRPRKKGGKPPAFVMEVGDVYAFPTMKSRPVNSWFASWEEAAFTPDGWGAFVVLDRGRAYEWFQWCTVGSLTVPERRTATLDEARSARFIHDPPSSMCVPRASHLTRMKAELLGKLPIDQAKAAKMHWERSKTARLEEQRRPPEYVVMVEWSISSVVAGSEGVRGTVPVKELFA